MTHQVFCTNCAKPIKLVQTGSKVSCPECKTVLAEKEAA